MSAAARENLGGRSPRGAGAARVARVTQPGAVMRRLVLLAPLALAACGGLVADPEAPPAPAMPAQVMAALPPGVPASVVTRGPDGCYLITVERTVPPTGYPLRDAAGQAVCDGQPVTVMAPA